MRTITLLACLLIATSIVAAAEVEVQSSGFSRGSYENIFPYIEGDTTVVRNVLPNDFIVIESGTSEYRLFFTRYVNEEWQYDIWRGERRLTIGQDERKSLDIDEDGETELVMTFTQQNLKKGTFTFTPPDDETSAPEEPSEETTPDGEENGTSTSEQPPSEQASPEPSPEPPAEEPAMPPAQEPPTPSEPVVVPPAEPVEEPDYFSYKLAVTLAVLVALIIYFVTAKPVGMARFGEWRKRKRREQHQKRAAKAEARQAREQKARETRKETQSAEEPSGKSPQIVSRRRIRR